MVRTMINLCIVEGRRKYEISYEGGLVCGAGSICRAVVRGAGSVCRTLVWSLMHRDSFTRDTRFMNHYALKEETPKAVCALNSKGEKKEEKEEGRRRKERGRRRESDLDSAVR